MGARTARKYLEKERVGVFQRLTLGSHREGALGSRRDRALSLVLAIGRRARLCMRGRGTHGR